MDGGKLEKMNKATLGSRENLYDGDIFSRKARTNGNLYSHWPHCHPSIIDGGMDRMVGTAKLQLGRRL